MNYSRERRNSCLNPLSKGREINIPSSLSTTSLATTPGRIGSQKRKSIPTISVNDRPIRNRRGSLAGYGVSNPIDRHIYGNDYGESDLTSSSAGMFSECLFEAAPKITADAGPSTGSSSSTSSIYTKSDLVDTDNLRRNSSSQSSSYRNKRRYSQNATNPGWYNGKRHSVRSHSSTFAPDRKRLVNQFLRSVDPLSSNDSTAVREDTAATAVAPGALDYDIDSNGKGSLQDFLYRDLEQLPRNTTLKAPQLPIAGITGSPSTSSTSSYSFMPRGSISSSSSFGGPEEPYVAPDLDMNNAVYDVSEPVCLNCNELDYCTRHIGSQLHNFENVIKQNLKSIIVNDEYEFQKNLKAFDALTVELKKSKQQVLQIYGSIRNKSLNSLRKEFDEAQQNTFMSRTKAVMEANVRHLENLEDRIEVSKEKLVRQRETLRRMESLLSLKDDMLASKRNAKLAYQYRYMVFDLGVLMALLSVFVLIKWLL